MLVGVDARGRPVSWVVPNLFGGDLVKYIVVSMLNLFILVVVVVMFPALPGYRLRDPSDSGELCWSY